MKFYQGFLGVLALGAGLMYTAMNYAIHTLVNTAMYFGGVALLGLDVLALAIWLVNWKYYSSD
ncbi:MAG: hypothetical protein V1672_05230 [Candidatus Diapherotrites archaeon]